MFNYNYERIAIIGCGGAGSKAAEILVRCGVKRLKLIDFDTIEKSNLARQFFFKSQIGKTKTMSLYKNLKKIDDTTDLIIVNKKITKENIHEITKDCDIIMEGVDIPEYTRMIAKELNHTKRLIVLSVAYTDDLSMNNIETKKITDVVYGVGSFDERYYSNNNIPYPPKVLNIVTKMVHKIIEEIRV